MEKQLERKPETAISNPQQIRRGFEEPSQREDLIIPRVKLLQALSPEVVDAPREFFPGELINSLTKEKLNQDQKPLRFIPVFKFTNWIRFNPRDDEKPGFDPVYAPGALVWSSKDPFDPRVIKEGSFGPNGELPLATKFLNFFAWLPDHPQMPVVLSFSKTSYRAGRQLLSLCQFGKTPDMFGTEYFLGVRQEKNEMGAYFVLTTAQGKAIDDRSLYNTCLALWDEFHDRDRDIEIHEQAEESSQEN